MTQITLASGSPRRKELLASLGVDFQVRTKPIDEDFSSDMAPEQVAAYLAKLKAEAFAYDIAPEELIITADTVVIHNQQILGKPADKAEAQRMLQTLSGAVHRVITGVCIFYKGHYYTFSETTQVTFKELTSGEINYYIDHYRPFDKAGAYGIQEWIGMVGIERIEGDYYNVVGFPLRIVYENLRKHLPTLFS